MVIRRAVEEGLFAANRLYWGDALTLTRRTRAGSWSCNCKRAERNKVLATGAAIEQVAWELIYVAFRLHQLRIDIDTHA